VQAILLDTHSFMSSEPPTTDDQVGSVDSYSYTPVNYTGSQNKPD